MASTASRTLEPTPPAGETSASPVGSARRRRRIQQKDWMPYVFLSPFFVIFGTFGLFPLLFSFYLAFQLWDPATGLSGMKFCGLDNFVFVVGNWFQKDWGDVVFWKSLYNTFWLALGSGLPQHFVAIPLAYFFHVAYKRWRNAITGAYFVPFITSSVAIALIFSSLFSKDFGVVNAVLDSWHKLPVIGGLFPDHHIDWLGKSPTIKPAVSFVVFWRYVGWNTVLYLSALQAISQDLFEAAEMDGASRWQTFSSVVVPLLRPMMLFAVTLTIIGNLQLFEEPFILLSPTGGAEQSGLTTAMYMYRTGFEYNEFGTASAISWILFVIIAVLTWVNNKVFAPKREEGMA
jgi:multiple sugar transport system permease protein